MVNQRSGFNNSLRIQERVELGVVNQRSGSNNSLWIWERVELGLVNQRSGSNNGVRSWERVVKSIDRFQSLSMDKKCKSPYDQPDILT